VSLIKSGNQAINIIQNRQIRLNGNESGKSTLQ